MADIKPFVKDNCDVYSGMLITVINGFSQLSDNIKKELCSGQIFIWFVKQWQGKVHNKSPGAQNEQDVSHSSARIDH